MPDFCSEAVILCRRSRLLLWLTLFLCLNRSTLSVADGENNASSLSPVFPTPLIRMLNDSAAASLRLQTENASYMVTNTSLNDLYNDNGTLQLQIRYRERKKQERLLSIQHEILRKLGFSRQPNVTSRLSEEERLRMVQMFDRASDAVGGATTTTSAPSEVQGESSVPLSGGTNPI